MIKFTVFMNPVAKSTKYRTVFTGRRTPKGKEITYVQAYNTSDTRKAMEYISIIAEQHRPKVRLEGEILLGMKFYRQTLKGFSGIKKEKAEAGIIRPATKPDLSNYIKLVEDSLSSVIWRDDAQVIEYLPGTGKYYSSTPRIEITVTEIVEIEKVAVDKQQLLLREDN